MSIFISRNYIVPAWLLIIGVFVLWRSPMSVVTTVLLLTAGLIAPAIFLILTKEPALTVGEVLHHVDVMPTPVTFSRSGYGESVMNEMKHTTLTSHAKIVDSDQTSRKDTHITKEDSPVRPGINAQTPGSMPRAEDDEETRAHSPEFHDRPGSGKLTADRQKVF